MSSTDPGRPRTNTSPPEGGRQLGSEPAPGAGATTSGRRRRATSLTSTGVTIRRSGPARRKRDASALAVGVTDEEVGDVGGEAGGVEGRSDQFSGRSSKVMARHDARIRPTGRGLFHRRHADLPDPPAAPGAAYREAMSVDDDHTRPEGTSDTTVEALGKLSEALEVVEDARGSSTASTASAGNGRPRPRRRRRPPARGRPRPSSPTTRDRPRGPQRPRGPLDLPDRRGVRRRLLRRVQGPRAPGPGAADRRASGTSTSPR